MNESIDPNAVWNRYQEICNDIRTTDDISFKILGLVPFVSGAALATILGTNHLTHADLIYIGLLGAVLTFGFYRWELRNIEICTWLEGCAADIEKGSLGLLGSPENPRGQFSGLPLAPLLFSWLHKPGKPRTSIRIGKKGAEHIIYLATIAAWLLLPAVAWIY